MTPGLKTGGKLFPQFVTVNATLEENVKNGIKEGFGEIFGEVILLVSPEEIIGNSEEDASQ